MKKNSKKIWSILFLLVIMVSTFGGTFKAVKAMTNPKYDKFIESTDYALDEVIESSTILDLMGSFVYALGSIVEKVVSDIMAVGGGGKFFPWSDLIVFNAIPLLDVNFINPNEKALVAKNGVFGQAIRNIYFSGMSVALGFLGIIVAVMAIKLALSTIANEKAKYKEAIVKWLTALVLLFGMHFVLSFLFYMNEILVQEASEIMINSLEKNSSKIYEKLIENLEGKQDKIVDNFIAKTQDTWFTSFVKALRTVSIGTFCPVLGAYDFFRQIEGISESADVDQLLRENRDITYALIANSTIRRNVLSKVGGNDANKDKNIFEKIGDWLSKQGSTIWNGSTPEQKEKAELLTYVLLISQANNGTLEKDRKALNEITRKLNEDKDLSADDKKQLQTLQVVYSLCVSKAQNGSVKAEDAPDKEKDKKSQQIITLIGEYFKTNAWYTDVDNGGWSPTEISIIAAILYTMLVFQSVGFLVSYVKRLVIVIVLSVISPFVVIYDFFTKSMQI